MASSSADLVIDVKNLNKSFGDKRVVTLEDFQAVLSGFKPGDKVKTKVRRGTETVEGETTLSRRPRPAYCDDLFIDGAETAALPAYSRLLAEDEKSLRLRYYEMYPTGTALLRPDEAADEPAAQATASG